MLAYLLFQDCSDVGVGGVSSQGENGLREGVCQGHHGDEGLLGGGESSLHGRRPGRALGLPESAAVSWRSVPAKPGRKRR